MTMLEKSQTPIGYTNIKDTVVSDDSVQLLKSFTYCHVNNVQDN
jgi:hypothetical protein